MTSTDQLDLDAIETRANAATPGPWCTVGAEIFQGAEYTPGVSPWIGETTRASGGMGKADAAYIAAMSPEVAKELVAEVRRLRADAADALLPNWEAMYEPGNVSNYLIGYANDEHAAKGAAEAWLRSQAEVTGRLEWESWGTVTDLPDGYDAWFELAERHDDGIDTGPGIVVRRRVSARAAVESHVVADDSDDPEPGTGRCGARHHDHPETVCTEPPGHYEPTVDPHAGPLVLDGRECGRAAWDEPTAPAARSAAV